MKLTAKISLLALLVLGSILPGIAQEPKKCQFNIVGTWKAQISPTETRLYTFDANGVVKVLNAIGTDTPTEIATAKYELLEDPKAPEEISFTATGKNRIFGRAKTAMKVVSFNDSSITCQIPGVGETRWTRVDADRYFIVLVARQEEFYDHSGSAFPLLVKIAGGVPKIDAAGLYSDKGVAAFGAVPANTYKDYLREARSDSEVILRLEINSSQYERALKVVQEWERRAREHKLLYTIDNALSAPLPLNNILLVKAVTETLNLCQDDVDLYKLDYAHPGDWITDKYGPEFVPFMYFKELRRRNEARHIEDKKFQELVPLANVAIR
ncbi:MAG TPA: hypothetical protein VFO99_04735 [Pyrinomonadaceae bacterium]|nr:hypothetical protein [Pyrinomonadaceae bacterium]